MAFLYPNNRWAQSFADEDETFDLNRSSPPIVPPTNWSGTSTIIQNELNKNIQNGGGIGGDYEPDSTTTMDNKDVSFKDNPLKYLFGKRSEVPEHKMIGDVPYPTVDKGSRAGNFLGIALPALIGGISGVGAIPAAGLASYEIDKSDQAQKKSANDQWLKGVYQKNQLDVQKQAALEKAQREEERLKRQKFLDDRKIYQDDKALKAKEEEAKQKYLKDINDIQVKKQEYGDDALTNIEIQMLQEYHRKGGR